MTDKDRENLRERLSAFADGVMTPAEKTAFEAELARSPELAKELELLKRLKGWIKDLPAAEPSPSFYRRVREAAEKPRRRWFITIPPLAAAAAAVMVMVLVRRDVRAPVRHDPADRNFFEDRDRALPADKTSVTMAAFGASSSWDGMGDESSREAGAVRDRVDEDRAFPVRSLKKSASLPPDKSSTLSQAAHAVKAPATPSPGARVQEHAVLPEIERALKLESAQARIGAISGRSAGLSGAGAAAPDDSGRDLSESLDPVKDRGGFSGAKSKISPDALKDAKERKANNAIPVLPEWRGSSSGIGEPLQKVLRTPADWASFWAQHAADRFPPPPAPAVDFNADMVAAVFAGEKSSGGYGMSITRIERASTEIIVLYLETAPVPGMTVTHALTQPHHIRVIPRSDLPVRFLQER